MESATPEESSSSSSEEEARNWLELPPEVTSMILLKLGAIEILTSAQNVCTSWRKICKDPAMWRSIDMHNLGNLWEMPYNLEIMARHAIDRSCGQLIDINIEYFGTDDLLKYITDRSTRVKRLRLVCCYNISDEALIEAADKLPLLTELDLSLCQFTKDPLEVVGRCCPLLKTFKLNSQVYRHPHIECDEEALAIAQNMRELRHLQLVGNKLTNDGLHAILDSCPHLVSLDLRRCCNVNLAGSLGRRCAETIKDLRRPYDATNDYGFQTENENDDDYGSIDEEYPYGYSDIDFLSDDEIDGFSGGSEFSVYGEFYFD